MFYIYFESIWDSNEENKKIYDFNLKTGFNMGNLNDTKTHENLKAAFAGESQANRRYLYFAKVADIEGYPEIASNFLTPDSLILIIPITSPASGHLG